MKKTVIMVPLSNDFSYKMSLTLGGTRNSSVIMAMNGKKIAEINVTEKTETYEIDLAGYKFNRLNKFEFIQENFIKEKTFLKVRQINFSKKH